MLIPGTICFVKSTGIIIPCSYEKRTIITLKYLHICHNLYLHAATSIQQRNELSVITLTPSRCHPSASSGHRPVTALIYYRKSNFFISWQQVRSSSDALSLSNVCRLNYNRFPELQQGGVPGCRLKPLSPSYYLPRTIDFNDVCDSLFCQAMERAYVIISSFKTKIIF